MAVAARTLEPLRRPRLRPVAAPRRGAAGRRAPFAVFALAVVGAMVVLLVSAQAMVAQQSFEVSSLSERARELEGEYGELRLRVAELSSPGRIAEAGRRAGLVLPARVESLRIPAVGEPPETPAVAGGSLALKGALGSGG